MCGECRCVGLLSGAHHPVLAAVRIDLVLVEDQLATPGQADEGHGAPVAQGVASLVALAQDERAAVRVGKVVVLKRGDET